MLTIKKEELNDKLDAFLNEVDIKEDLHGKIIMCAKDDDVYLGVVTLELRIDKVYLNLVKTKSDDLVLKLALIKSMLNLADLRGIKMVYGENEELASLYTMSKFVKENDQYALNLEGYFTCGC